MTLRKSVHESFSDPGYGGGADDVSDFQAVDQTQGFALRLIGVCVRLWWIFIIVIGLAAVSFPYLFPQWAKSYQDELKGISSATDTSKLLRNIARVDWRRAFTRRNLENLKYVGTGLHPVFGDDPALKEKWFYSGQVLIMKTYVSDYDMMSSRERRVWNAKGGLKFPAIGVEHGEAAEYCASLGTGTRLPTYRELSIAYLLSLEKEGQGAVGKALKPNLDLKLFESKALWTTDRQPSSGWLSGLGSGDNFRVFVPGGIDREIYKDDGFESHELSFLCVRQLE